MQDAKRRKQPARAQQCRTIRLVGGSSPQAPSWYLQAGPGGTALSIGAGPDCEWRIRAAGVPAQALWLMLTDQGLYARAARDGTVRVDGTVLGTDWLPVPAAARIDIGMASLLVSAEEAIELEPVDPDQSGMRLTPAPEPQSRPSLIDVWRFSRESLPDAPSVLGRYRTSVDRRWLYFVSGLALAGYGVWVALLE